MTNRERVERAIRFLPNDKIPYDMDFTSQFQERMNDYLAENHISFTPDRHMCTAEMVRPAWPLAHRPGFFQDPFGVIWNRTGADKDIGVVENVQITSQEELDAYEFPRVDAAFIEQQCNDLSVRGEGKFRVASLSFSLYERAWTLMGMEDLLCAMVTDPPLVHALLRKICDFNLSVLRTALQYDFEGFYFGDDWGQQKGLIMGAQLWRTFIKPYLTELYQEVRNANRFVLQHSCGDIRDVMDDLIAIGLNVYQTFQPEIYGLDYAQVLRGRLAIWGGISVQTDLPYKTPHEMEGITLCTAWAFSQGGLILAPTHAVPGDVLPQNILAVAGVMERQASLLPTQQNT